MSTFESTLSLADHFQQQGFAVLEKCLSAETVARFVELTELARKSRDSESAVANSAGVYALRNLTDVVPETTELVRNPAVREIVETILGSNAFLIRSTLFDKTDGANWGVFWHQDLSIAVEQRHDVDGFHAWTRKAKRSQKGGSQKGTFYFNDKKCRVMESGCHAHSELLAAVLFTMS